MSKTGSPQFRIKPDFWPQSELGGVAVLNRAMSHLKERGKLEDAQKLRDLMESKFPSQLRAVCALNNMRSYLLDRYYGKGCFGWSVDNWPEEWAFSITEGPLRGVEFEVYGYGRLTPNSILSPKPEVSRVKPVQGWTIDLDVPEGFTIVLV